jgi:hypothetical protein
MDTAIFNSMYVEGSTIFLDSVLTSETLQQPPTLRPFPISFDSNEDHSKVEAVLAYSGCVEALMYLHNFAKALLAGELIFSPPCPISLLAANQDIDLCSKIEEITVSPANLKFRIIHVTADGSLFDRPNDHNLYKVTLKNGDVWAVDPSGAQFGYTNPLSAWHNYQRHRLSKVNTVVEFGHISRYLFNTTANLYESPGECESTDWVAQRVEKRTLAKMIDEIISAQDLSNMLTGSDGVFESAKGRFLERLEGHVKSAMERLYSREVLQRLRQEVDGEMDLVRQFANTRIFRY